MPQNLVSADIVFVCPRLANARSFLTSPPFMIGFKKNNNFTLNSTNLSTSDRMNEMNFRNPKFVSGLAFHHLELLISGGLSHQKAPLQNVRFASVALVCSKIFLQALSRIPEKQPFWSWLRPRSWAAAGFSM